MKPIRTIKFAARQSGLSVPLIRMWEKRYGAVKPRRAANNRRLYTEEDVERLRLLREATQAGHSISQIAQARLPQLQSLVQEAAGSPPRSAAKGAPTAETVAAFVTQALAGIRELDRQHLRGVLDRAAMELGSPAALQKFISPLARQIGEWWRAGDLNIAHEHFATNEITSYLEAFARPYAENLTAPHLVMATPSGQLHELGAIIVCAAARSHGWRTTYLGPALPVEELAGALGRLQPRAVGLSIVYPPDDAALQQDLRKLPAIMPAGCALLVGGESATGYADLLREIKAIHVHDLEDLFPVLDKLQRTSRKL